MITTRMIISISSYITLFYISCINFIIFVIFLLYKKIILKFLKFHKRFLQCRVTCNSICHELNYLPCVSVPHRTLLIENYCPPEQTFHHELRPDLILFTDKTFSIATTFCQVLKHPWELH